MARPTKTQQRNNAEVRVRSEKALQTIAEQFSKLVGKHIVGMLGAGNGSTFTVEGAITSDDIGSLRLTYQTTVTDGAGFKLDDGQIEMALKTGTPPASTDPAAPAPTPGSGEGDQ